MLKGDREGGSFELHGSLDPSAYPIALAPPLVVLCRVGTHCNLSCAFCAYDRRLPFARSWMADGIVEQLIGRLAREQGRSGRDILLSWIGGEPLLWPRWVHYSRLARAQGLRLSATSNGSTLGRSAVRELAVEVFDELTLSLDAADARHDRLRGWPGGARRVLQALAELRRRREGLGQGPLLRVNVVLMRSTIDGLDVLCEELLRNGVDEISLNLLGGRDRPEFHAAEAVLPEQMESLVADLPELRSRLTTHGVRLLGSDAYFRLLLAVSQGRAQAVADCAPGREFLFVDEGGRVAPCAFTGEELGVGIEETLARGLQNLPGRYAAKRGACAPKVCANCPSTQVAGKFSGTLP